MCDRLFSTEAFEAAEADSVHIPSYSHVPLVTNRASLLEGCLIWRIIGKFRYTHTPSQVTQAAHTRNQIERFLKSLLLKTNTEIKKMSLLNALQSGSGQQKIIRKLFVADIHTLGAYTTDRISRQSSAEWLVEGRACSSSGTGYRTYNHRMMLSWLESQQECDQKYFFTLICLWMPLVCSRFRSAGSLC